MGVDARMIVRVPDGQFTDETLRPIAARLAATVGKETFSIVRPDDWDWYGSKGRHALSLTDETAGGYLDEMEEYLTAEEIDALKAVERGRPILSQDGPPLIAEKNEQFVQVNLGGRYYGVGYERGDWPSIRAAAEFVEHVFPGCAVYYGGDSSGVLAAPFDEAARKALNDHYLTNGHAPYRGYRGVWDKSARPTCDFCGGVEMNDVGGSADVTFYSCDGCGYRIVGNKGVFGDKVTDIEPLTRNERRGGDGWNGATERLRSRMQEKA